MADNAQKTTEAQTRLTDHGNSTGQSGSSYTVEKTEHKTGPITQPQSVSFQKDKDPESVPPKPIHISKLPEPPDGGTRAYSIVVAAFIINGLIFGPINTFSVVYPILVKSLEQAGSEDAENLAALLGSLTLGVMFIISPVTGLLTAILGMRATTVLGGLIATCGCLMSTFLHHRIDALYFTYGVMYGIGASFAYTPSLAILGLYFNKRLCLVNGIVSSGGSVFTIIMPTIYEFILDNYNLHHLFGFLTVINTLVAVCGLLLKPLGHELHADVNLRWRSHLKVALRADLFKKRKYNIWILSMPVALFGYFVPYVHLKMFMMTRKFSNINENLPLMGMATMSALSPTIVGLIADKPSIDAVVLQQISFYVIGCTTIILPFVKSFPLLVTLCMGMGVCDGAFVALIGPVATRLAGVENAALGIGIMLGLVAIPMSTGPAIAGELYSETHSYTLPFILSGSTPLVGATLLSLIHLQKN